VDEVDFSGQGGRFEVPRSASRLPESWRVSRRMR